MSGAPALERGIALLQLLDQEPGVGLDALTTASGYPKSSVLRMLETLGELGLVRRENDGGWRPLQRLVPIPRVGTELDSQRLLDTLRNLALDSDATAEWWLPSDAGMVLAQRAEPPGGEVAVRARCGYLRRWEGESEAVALVGLARLRSDIAPPSTSWHYRQAGVEQQLGARAVRELVTSAGDRGWAIDPASNSNGVRRLAKAVGDHGVLALATFTPAGSNDPIDHLLPLLERAAAELLSP